MFLDRWIPAKFFIKQEVCSVEICYAETGVTYYYTHLRNKGKKLELSETGKMNDSLKLPERFHKDKIPLVLILNGRGIIMKKITFNQESEQSYDEIIKQNLPAVNVDEFYIQLFRQNDFTAFVTMCRKEPVNALISDLREKKYELAKVLIGPASIMGMEPVWSDYNSISTSLQTVSLTNGCIDSIGIKQEQTNETVKVDGLSFDSDHTLGFSGSLSYLLQRRVEESLSGELSAMEKRHSEKNKFRFLLLMAVGIAFFLAVTNVAFYTYYFDENNKLETQLSVYQGKYDQINQLLSDYQKNKGLIESAGVLGENRLSEYADRIGKTIPDEVVLTDLHFNPKKEEEESADSLITFESKHLILKGNCAKSFILNEWINVLKMQKFVKDVGLEKFVYNKEGLLPNFEIKIITN